jgi:glutathione S-transferase
MYTLHIANKNYSSWSLRPWLLMKELDIPFQEQLTPFEDEVNYLNFKAFSPNGQVPCLIDNDLIIWESLAITEYLYEKYPLVWPSSSPARAWARSAAAEMHAGFNALRSQCPMNCGVRVRMNKIDTALQKDLTRIDELWCDGLTRFKGPFLAGAGFSGVDAFFAPVVFRLQIYGLATSPKINQYMERILARPSIKDWAQQAIAEPWRESSHEKETLAAGIIITDLR